MRPSETLPHNGAFPFLRCRHEYARAFRRAVRWRDRHRAAARCDGAGRLRQYGNRMKKRGRSLPGARFAGRSPRETFLFEFDMPPVGPDGIGRRQGASCRFPHPVPERFRRFRMRRPHVFLCPPPSPGPPGMERRIGGLRIGRKPIAECRAARAAVRSALRSLLRSAFLPVSVRRRAARAGLHPAPNIGRKGRTRAESRANRSLAPYLIFLRTAADQQPQ